MNYSNDKHGITFFPHEQLQRMSFTRLMRHLRALRAVISNMNRSLGRRCCTLCNEFIGTKDDWEVEVAQFTRPYRRHMKEVKTVLANHPHKDSPLMRRK